MRKTIRAGAKNQRFAGLDTKDHRFTGLRSRVLLDPKSNSLLGETPATISRDIPNAATRSRPQRPRCSNTALYRPAVERESPARYEQKFASVRNPFRGNCSNEKIG